MEAGKNKVLYEAIKTRKQNYTIQYQVVHVMYANT